MVNLKGQAVLTSAVILLSFIFMSTALADEPKIGAYPPTVLETLKNIEEDLNPEYTVYADTYYNIEEEVLRTEFASELEVRDFTLGLYPLVNFEDQEIEELKLEVKYNMEFNSLTLRPYGELAWDEDLDHSESTLGFKVSKKF
tara:strand:- start:5142 stop:5570 length:429 start_codon:yes stop_codon:yes gene_type:complete